MKDRYNVPPPALSLPDARVKDTVLPDSSCVMASAVDEVYRLTFKPAVTPVTVTVSSLAPYAFVMLTLKEDGTAVTGSALKETAFRLLSALLPFATAT